MTTPERRIHEPDREPAAPAAPAASSACPSCSATLQGRKCKLLCPRCGYFESCSDLEPAPPLA